MRGPAALNKYKLGLLAIGVFTVILLVMVLMQAGAVKQDTNTYNKATDIANKLNTYVNTNLVVPSTLSEAGINDVPSTITYKKIDYTSYQFCVYYKTKSNNFDPYSAEGDVLSAASGSGFSGTAGGGSGSNFDLFIDTTHNKGNNCQTVNAQITANNMNSNLNNNNGNDPYAKCYSIADNTAYQNCLNQVDQSQNVNTQTN